MTRSMIAGILVVAGVLPAHSATDNLGSEFWLAFPANYTPPAVKLFITSDEPASGTVEVAGVGFSQAFSTTPGEITEMILPSSVEVTSPGVVQQKGVRVTADRDVAVYGLSVRQASSDAYLGLPTDALGTEHIVASYENSYSHNQSQFAIVGTVDGTTVEITAGSNAPSHPAPLTVELDEGETYLLRESSFGGDLTGAVVLSDEPVAVFGGARCANIPTGRYFACDTIVEQLPHVGTWGDRFGVVPLATRVGDTVRILAAQDGTEVTVDGTLVATLDRGEVHEMLGSAYHDIASSAPVFVVQYSNSSSYDGSTGDPFMMMIPPLSQFLTHYTVATAGSAFVSNFVNVVAPDDAVGSITLDGTPIPAGSFVSIGSSGYSGAQVAISPGTHNLEGPRRFGVFTYGFNSYDSYGYPGGMNVTDNDCPENGFGPLDGTPAEGAVSEVVHDQVEPIVGDVDPAAQAAVHEVNCVIAAAEDAAEAIVDP